MLSTKSGNETMMDNSKNSESWNPVKMPTRKHANATKAIQKDETVNLQMFRQIQNHCDERLTTTTSSA